MNYDLKSERGIREYCNDILEKYNEFVLVRFIEYSYLNACINTYTRVLTLDHSILEYFEENEIRAILGHEMGHLFQPQELSKKDKEYFADAKSLELGASRWDMIDVLLKLSFTEIKHTENELNTESFNSHPSFNERIEKLLSI